jgi:Flp pilus assembly protein TadG
MNVLQPPKKRTERNKARTRFGTPLSNERGVAALVMAFLLVVLVALTSIVIDLGFAWVTKNELQNIADAAALAGTRQLGLAYEGLSPQEREDTSRILTSDEKARIVTAVLAVGGLNQAGGKNGITIDITSDVGIGTWDFATKTLTPTLVRPTAVTVTARRDAKANTPIRTVFATVIGHSELHVGATATAALGPLGSMPPGAGGFPVGISKRWFDEGHQCGDYIKFHPTGTLEGCAGWHTFTDGPANASELRKVLTGLRNDTYNSPEIIAGQTQLEFSGGTLSSVFDEMQALYEAKKNHTTGEWNVKIPVYDSTDCSNPSGAIKIVGFATATVTKVIEAPDKEIIAKVTCDKIEAGRPGGTMGGGGFAPLSTVPALVS